MPSLFATIAKNAFQSSELLYEEHLITETANLASAGGGVANRAVYIGIRLPESVTIKRLLWRVGDATGGNYDIGLYDSDSEGEPDSRLASLGSTAVPSANTNVASNISDQTIGPGLFYIAFVFDGTTAHIESHTTVSDQNLLKYRGHVWYQVSAFPLPATATPVKSGGAFIPAISAVRDA